ncbi:hypothetical protein BDZ89DRAFT_1080021 [Hymenopellis radicata]|nr:hypothetical protein BDZ89DRAFT_1080021 [Hymenopellis radicata]
MLAPAGRLPGDFTGLPFGAVSSMEGFRNDAVQRNLVIEETSTGLRKRVGFAESVPSRERVPRVWASSNVSYSGD